MTAEPSKRRLVADTTWSATGVVISAACAAAYLILIGNCWGAHGLGVFSLGLSIYTVSAMLFSLGIHQAAMYEVAARRADPAAASQYAWTALVASAVLGLVVTGLGILLAPLARHIFQGDELPAMLRVLAFSLPLFLLNKTAFAILNAHRRMGLLAMAESIRSFTVIGVMAVAAMRGHGVATAAFAFLLAEVLVLVFLGAMCIRVQPPAQPSRACLSPMLRFGLKAALADAVGDLSTRLDVLVIGLFWEASVVGLYALASAGAKALWLLPAAIQRVTHPLFVHLHATGQVQKFHRAIDLLLRLGTVTFLPLGLCAAVCSSWVIQLIYPQRPDLLAAVLPLQYLLPGAIAYAIMTLIGTAPSSSIGRPGNAVRIILVMLLTNLALTFGLAPRFGAIGAAAATAISLLVGFVHTALLLRSQVGYLLPARRYGLLLVGYVAIAAACHHLSGAVPAGLLFLGGAAAVLALLWALRLADLSDFRELIHLLR